MHRKPPRHSPSQDHGKTYVIVNAMSGTVRSMGPEAVKTILQQGLKPHQPHVQIHVVPSNEIDGLVDKAKADHEVTRIIVGGGDGTLSTVAAKLINSEIAMGILPLGTMNLFALANGMSPDLKSAVNQLIDATVAKIDVGIANEQIFLRQVSLGLQPAIVKERETLGYRSRITKKLSGLKALMIVLSRAHNLFFKATADGKPMTLTSPALYISNNKFAKGLLPHQDSLDRGIIAVYAFRSMHFWDLLKMSRYIFRGCWWESPNVDTLYVRELILQSVIKKSGGPESPTILVSLDGELQTLPLPLTIKSEPGILHVLQGH